MQKTKLSVISRLTDVMKTQTRRRVLIAGTLAASSVLWTACQSLEVTNPSTPNIDVVYGSGENLEAALVGSWRAFWGVAQGSRTNAVYPVKHLAVWGNEMTTADNSNSGLVVTQEPRVALDNTDQGGWFNRKPWYDLYESMSSARDAWQAIDGGLKVGVVTAEDPNGTDTARDKIFAKFMIAINNLYLALLFDQAYLADETANIQTFKYELKPYTEVATLAKKMLRETIAEAKAAKDFSLPPTFINGKTISRDEFVRIMYSYLVRADVYMPRSPADRGAVNWAGVLARLDSTITVDFAQQADQAISATSSAYYQYSYLQTNGRANNRLIGPADTSGAYQSWIAKPLKDRVAFRIVTPDRRIQGTTSTSDGTDFGYLSRQTMSSSNGTYMHSMYRSKKYIIPTNDYYYAGLITTMSVAEMQFIKAEALYRLNRGAEAAAILNVTRVPANLQPVTASGPPAGRNCVPRREDGSCGDLFDAIQYEKRIVLYPTEAIISYTDARGWGKLIPGTPIHMPVHGRELETMGFPIYTFGGGGVGSAP